MPKKKGARKKASEKLSKKEKKARNLAYNKKKFQKQRRSRAKNLYVNITGVTKSLLLLKHLF